MKTVVTFANLYRSRPYVKVVEGENFVILISKTKGLCIVRDWSAESDLDLDPDLALDVECVDGSDERWRLAIHPDSPIMEIIEAQLMPPGPRGPLDHRMRPSLALRVSSWTMSSAQSWPVGNGEVVYFKMADLPSAKTYQVMFAVQEEASRESAESPHQPTLTDLPADLLPKILKHLTSEQLLGTIPFVSTQLFQALKCGESWEKIKFGHQMMPCSEDLKALSELAREGCNEISWDCWERHGDAMDYGCEVTDGKRQFQILLIDTKWRNVKKLRIAGDCVGFEQGLLSILLRKRNFPSLNTLELSPRLLSATLLTWRILFDVPPPPSLRALVVEIGVVEVRPVPRASDPRILAAMSKCFAHLEKLHVYYRRELPYESEAYLFVEAMRNGLPELKELKVVGSNMIGHLLQEPAVSYAAVKRLLAVGCVLDPDYDADPESLDSASQMLAVFPGLDTLVLGENYCLNWEDVRPTSLEQLTTIRAQMSSRAVIPFNMMVNLEVASVGLYRGKEQDQQRESIQGLLELPHLRALKLQFPDVRDEVASLSLFTRCLVAGENLRVAEGPVTVLEVETGGGLDEAEAEQLGRFLSSFPQVTQLHVICEKVYSVSGLAFLVAAQAKNLVRLDVTCTQGTGTLVGSFHVECPLREWVHRLESRLKASDGSWAVVDGRHKVNPAWPEMQSAAVQRGGFKELNPFDDEIFDMPRRSGVDYGHGSTPDSEDENSTPNSYDEA